MLANLQQPRSRRLDLDQKPKLHHKVHIKYHNLIDRLRAALTSGHVADGKIKFYLLVVVEGLFCCFEDTAEIG